jgi:2-C-methyl-D-erythritol 4-phosphate cytidylyltransferase
VDTLKQVDEERRIRSTVPRAEVWHAQTPQIFPRELIVQAYRAALRAGLTDTDDAALVERMGGEVVMAMGSPSNIKVTMPEDLEWVEFLLARGLE